MSKFALTLLPALFGIITFNGCDSSCCSDLKPAGMKAPVPVITRDGQKLNGTLTCNPATEETITLKAASTDSDGNVVDNIWKVDGKVDNDGIIECPAPGKSKEICLVAIDNDNLQNQTCITLTATAASQPQLKPPVIAIAPDTARGEGYIKCTQIHDQDQIDSDHKVNKYGTDHAIKEIYWHIDYTGKAPHIVTQTQWNEENADYTEGECGKWIDTDYLPATIIVTPVDDDDQNKTYRYEMGTDGSITPAS